MKCNQIESDKDKDVLLPEKEYKKHFGFMKY